MDIAHLRDAKLIIWGFFNHWQKFDFYHKDIICSQKTQNQNSLIESSFFNTGNKYISKSLVPLQ